MRLVGWQLMLSGLASYRRLRHTHKGITDTAAARDALKAARQEAAAAAAALAKAEGAARSTNDARNPLRRRRCTFATQRLQPPNSSQRHLPIARIRLRVMPEQAARHTQHPKMRILRLLQLRRL